MKSMRPEVVTLQARIFAERLKLGQVLNRAGLNRSTWSRWVSGSEPKLSNLDAMNAAIDAKIAERKTA